MPILDPQRLFSAPPLSGSAPQDLRFAPSEAGNFLTYRAAAQDDRFRMDLWRIDLDDPKATPRVWVDARKIGQPMDASKLTKAERAERERRRQFTHGINSYHWLQDARRLLLPADGQAYLVDATKPNGSVRALCPEGTRQSGFTLSPNNTYLSFVRAGDLYITQIDSGEEQRLTHDANSTLANGLPDLLAAEEMHRFEGHWWSADERHLVYCKVDEDAVEPSFRLEMEADGASTIAQRYPYAGAVNPTVTLHLVDLSQGQQTQIWPDESAQQSEYLARVDFGENEIVVQTQDRLQQHLYIERYRLGDATWQLLYHEQSETWINLNDDFKRLADDNYLISSEDSPSKTRRLYRLNTTNSTVQRVSLDGPTHINAVVGTDEEALYATGWEADPQQNHLFKIPLNGHTYSRLTRADGWHDVVVDPSSGRFIDRHSDTDRPLKVEVAPLVPSPPPNSNSSVARPHSIYSDAFDAAHPYSPYLSSHAASDFGHIEASDGQQLYYRLTPPTRIEGRHATILYVYGGPGAQKARREWSPLTVQLFAQQGFAVLELDNRGSSNRGHGFEAPLYQKMGSIEVEDQVASLAVLDQYPWADRERVGVYGHSYGGYMTLMCLSRAASHFAAGVAVAPVCDWQLYDSHYTERFMGLPEQSRDAYEASNVLSDLAQLRAPLLLMHGMADDNVLFTHSTLIMGKLQSLNTPFELMTYPGAKHSMQERHVSIHRFDMILRFLKMHLT